jgi:hypothetical protein
MGDRRRHPRHGRSVCRRHGAAGDRGGGRMTAPVLWQTDDCCPLCGGLLRQRTQADGSITHECGCGWYATWQADPEGGQR